MLGFITMSEYAPPPPPNPFRIVSHSDRSGLRRLQTRGVPPRVLSQLGKEISSSVVSR